MSLVITLYPPPASFPPLVFVADVKNYYKMTTTYTVNGKIIGVKIFFH